MLGFSLGRSLRKSDDLHKADGCPFLIHALATNGARYVTAIQTGSTPAEIITQKVRKGLNTEMQFPFGSIPRNIVLTFSAWQRWQVYKWQMLNWGTQHCDTMWQQRAGLIAPITIWLLLLSKLSRWITNRLPLHRTLHTATLLLMYDMKQPGRNLVSMAGILFICSIWKIAIMNSEMVYKSRLKYYMQHEQYNGRA